MNRERLSANAQYAKFIAYSVCMNAGQKMMNLGDDIKLSGMKVRNHFENKMMDMAIDIMQKAIR